jgi:Acyl-CoA dehydrogenase, C-terminal domain
MLADSLTELFAARALTYETARSTDAGADVKVAHAQCSMAKLYASEMAGLHARWRQWHAEPVLPRDRQFRIESAYAHAVAVPLAIRCLHM